MDNGLVVLSMYHGEHLLEWFDTDFSISDYLIFNGKKYDVLNLIPDVIEFDRLEISGAMDRETTPYYFPDSAIRQNSFILDEYGPKGIILILKEKENE